MADEEQNNENQLPGGAPMGEGVPVDSPNAAPGISDEEIGGVMNDMSVGGESEPVPPESTEGTRDFVDMVDFYKTAKIGRFGELAPEIMDFISAYEAINRGCGCSKKNRIVHAEKMFLNLANLKEETVSSLKGLVNADKIRMFHNAGLFAEL